jgi:hypothetical protein
VDCASEEVEVAVSESALQAAATVEVADLCLAGSASR